MYHGEGGGGGDDRISVRASNSSSGGSCGGGVERYCRYGGCDIIIWYSKFPGGAGE